MLRDSSAENGEVDAKQLLSLLGDIQASPEDVKLKLLEAMDDYTPSIPEPVVDHYLGRSGCQTSDIKV